MSQVGQFIGNYEILRLLGQGGMGQVYLGKHRQTGQEVAIKVVIPEALKDSPDFLERFRREGEALRLLNHPNIVKMVEVIQAEEQSCIVLEYVDGGTLADLIQEKGQLPLEQVLAISIELADALTRAHHLKIIHRDLKPSNILLTKTGQPLLTDFGLVRMESEDQLTRTGVLVGSVGYLSPEALNDAPTDPKMDIWAFGVVIYEMLAGRRPFEGGTNTATLAAILTEPLPDMSQFRTDLPLSLVVLLEQMLEKKPALRVASVRQVGAELEKLRQNLGDAPRYTPNEQAKRKSIPLAESRTQGGGDEATLVAPTPLPDKYDLPQKRFEARWVVFALGLLALLAGVFFLNLDLNTETTPSDAVVVLEVPPADNLNDLLILVAQFEPLEAERPLDRFILDDLQQTLDGSYAYLPITVREYPQIITDKGQAAMVAEANNAAVVIWGNYDMALVEAQIQLNPLVVNSQMASDFLAESGEVRVRLTDVREQSLAKDVLVAITVIQAFKADAYEAASSMLTYQDVQVGQGEIMGTSVGTHVYRHYELLYSDPVAAIDSLEAALRISPSNPFVYNLKAAALERVDQREAARQDAQTALRLANNEWALPHIATANIDSALGDLQSATLQLDQATVLRPEDWLPYTMRGSYYFLQGDYDKAKVELEGSIEREPKANFPYVLLMNIAVREGELEQIDSLMEAVLTKFPDPTLANRVILTAGVQPEFGGFYSQLLSAFSNMALGRYQDAIVDLEAAVAVRADIPEVFLFQGIAYCANGENEKAEAAYTAGLALDPDFTVLYLLRADVRSRLNRLGDSLLDFGAAQATTQWEKFEPFINETLASGSNALGCESFFG